MGKMRVVLVASLVITVALTYSLYVFYEVWRHAHNEEAQTADVIVVLGAAQYRGRPSPVLKARLDHALDLYRRNLATHLITTGGQSQGAEFTEGEVRRQYLSDHGVPTESITAETQGHSTVQSIEGVVERMHLSSCIVVSDGYHIHRIKKILQDQGLQVYGSPRTPGDDSIWTRGKYYVREIAGYIFWRLGFGV